MLYKVDVHNIATENIIIRYETFRRRGIKDDC